MGLLSTPGQSIDLLGALGIYNSTWEGVTLTPGSRPFSQAYNMQGKRSYRAEIYTKNALL